MGLNFEILCLKTEIEHRSPYLLILCCISGVECTIDIPVDFKFMSCTFLMLQECMDKDLFSEDLF